MLKTRSRLVVGVLSLTVLVGCVGPCRSPRRDRDHHKPPTAGEPDQADPAPAPDGWLQPLSWEAGPKGGGRRTADLHVPAQRAKPTPAIVAFHGKGGDGTEMAGRFDEVRDQGYVLVFPDAIENWAGLDHHDVANIDPTRDIESFRKLVDVLVTDYNVDPNQISVAGFSQGSHMVWQLVCFAPELISGGAVFGLTMGPKTQAACKPKKAVPIAWGIGTDDPNVDNQIPHDEMVRTLKDLLGCSGPGVTTTFQDANPAENTTATETNFTGCREQPLRTFSVTNGGHMWPGAGKKKEGNCHDFSATDRIVDFWRACGSVK